MGVLPKGQRWPNSCTPAILAANARLQAYADVNPDWLTCLDIGDQFLTHQVTSALQNLRETLVRHASSLMLCKPPKAVAVAS